MVSHQQVVLAYCVLQYPVLLCGLNSHENFFGATITKHTSTTNEHPFLRRDLILHQLWGFGSTPLSVRTPGLGDEFYVTELWSRAVIKKSALSLYFIKTGVICKLKISTHVWDVPWIMKNISRWPAAKDAVRLCKNRYVFSGRYGAHLRRIQS